MQAAIGHHAEMKSLDEYLQEAEIAHGHLCAGQVLGVRLAMLGLAKLGIDDPRGKDRKRLVTFVRSIVARPMRSPWLLDAASANVL